MGLGRLAVRGLVGGLFIGHGTQKLYGWFGGPGPEGTEGMMESLEMRPAKLHAKAAGLSETIGGGFLVVGLATPVAAAALTGVMTTAIEKVHKANGTWAANGGWEYNAVLVAALAALVETGPGKISLDAAFGIEKKGSLWALGALAGGVAASYLTIEAGRRGSAGELREETVSAEAEPSRAVAAGAAQGETAADPTTVGASDPVRLDIR